MSQNNYLLHMAEKVSINERDLVEMVKAIIKESVFLSNLKGDKAMLAYKPGYAKRFGNLLKHDKITTNKMEQNNSDTYIVPLKGGLNSYNITSIDGQYVMHYFKYYWDNKDAQIKFKDETGKEKDYKLAMQKQQFDAFLSQFKKKVEIVVKHYLGTVANQDITGVSIYPVPSSSKFNEHMAKELTGLNLYGLPVQAISQSLFNKDTSNLQIDNDFIEKNKEYYSQNLGYQKNKLAHPITSYLDADMRRENAMSNVQKFIDEVNQYEAQILSCLNTYKNSVSKGSKLTLRHLVNFYRLYYDYIQAAIQKSEYYDTIKGKNVNPQKDKLIAYKKYSKEASINKRTDEIWALVKPYVRGKVSSITNEPYKKFPVATWVRADLEMKALSNPERMGLKNFFSLNPEVLEKEKERIDGTLFIIFDDNISGGATLSDICLQAKNAGIKNILPITFGKMETQWSKENTATIRPINKDGKKGMFNYE